MEERDRKNKARLEGIRLLRRLRHDADDRSTCEGPKRIQNRVVRRNRTFRKPRRATRVEYRRVIFLVHFDVGHRGPSRQHVFKTIDARRKFTLMTNTNRLYTELFKRSLGRSCAFDVSHQHLSATVLEAVGHLLRCPPSIHADCDSADGSHRGERKNPLGVVPHGDRNAVAGLHGEVGDQSRGERMAVGNDVGVGPGLALVDQEVLVAPRGRSNECGGQVRRRIREDRILPTPDFGSGEFQRGSRGREARARLFESEHGRTL